MNNLNIAAMIEGVNETQATIICLLQQSDFRNQAIEKRLLYLESKYPDALANAVNIMRELQKG